MPKFFRTVTLSVWGECGDGVDPDDMLRDNTEFLLEPLSREGTVTKVKLQDVDGV